MFSTQLQVPYPIAAAASQHRLLISTRIIILRSRTHLGLNRPAISILATLITSVVIISPLVIFSQSKSIHQDYV